MRQRLTLMYQNLWAHLKNPRSKASLSALLVTIIFAPALWLGSLRFEAQLLADQRAHVASDLHPYMDSISSAMRTRFSVLEGLKAFIAAEVRELPNEDLGAHLEDYAREFLADGKGVRYFSIAPGGVQRYIYPLVGNEHVLGQDVTSEGSPAAHVDVQRAIETRRIALTRLYSQDDGSPEWVAWLAVNRGDTFWGLVSMRMHIPSVLDETTLSDNGSTLSLAVRDEGGQVLYGPSEVFHTGPLTYRIETPDGFWELAGIPTGGWDSSIRRTLLIFRTSGLVFIGLLASLAYLIANRQAVLALTVKERTREISRINEELTRDIAQRRQAEERLQEARRTLSTLMSNLPGMAYRCRNDSRRTMEFVSEGCFELTGYHPAELIGDEKVPYAQLIHADDRESVWSEVQETASAGRPYRLLYRIVTAGGAEKWVSEQGRGIISSSGELHALEGIITDATDRVVNEQVLEQRVVERSRQLAALYDVSAVSSTSLNLKTVLEHSLSRILAVVETEMGVIQLSDVNSGLLRLAASHGVPPEIIARLDLALDGQTLPNWVVRYGQAVVVPDIAADPRAGEVGQAFGSWAYVGVPIRARGHVTGVLSVIRDRSRPFNPGETALLTAIGDQLGVAVENARLMVEAQGKAVLEERQRLARELHDSATQLLYSLTLMAEAGYRLAGAGNLERARDYLGRMGETAQQTLKEMRLLVYQLRPSTLEQDGLTGALQRRLDAVEKRAGVEAQLLVEHPLNLPAAVEDGLYHIAQEALNNALKHATATSVTVRIKTGGNCLALEVEDDGKGFDPVAVGDRGGLGLVSMRERAEQLGGSLSVISRPAMGTCVQVKIGMRLDATLVGDRLEVLQ